MLIKNISSCIEKEIFKEISNYCDNNELESYVIGGYVRDHLIGKTGSKDIDILIVGDLHLRRSV